MFSRKVVTLRNLLRNYSKENNLVSVIIDKTGISRVTLNRPPVNSLNLEMLTELSSILTNLETNRSRGIILTSFTDRAFSSGIDLAELHKPDEERLKLYWTTMQDVWIKLTNHNSPTVACINGHAPTTAFLLTMTCEYRVMVKDKQIGLKGTQMGLLTPLWAINQLKYTIGDRQAEIFLTSGKMYTTEEAHKIGLIDEIAEDTENAIQKSQTFLETFKDVSYSTRATTKKMLREQHLQDLLRDRDADSKLFYEEIMGQETQEAIYSYFKTLKR